MSDKDVVNSGGWVDCRICFDVFRRRRQTARYCAKCENGFCEGEHGSFAYGHGRCVICGVHKSYTQKQDHQRAGFVADDPTLSQARVDAIKARLFKYPFL